MIVLDSCTIKYWIAEKKYGLFKDKYVLTFQKNELTPKEWDLFFKCGGLIVEQSEILKGDLNFFTLDPLKYSIFTYDKKLKKALKKKAYNTIFLKNYF